MCLQKLFLHNNTGTGALNPEVLLSYHHTFLLMSVLKIWWYINTISRNLFRIYMRWYVSVFRWKDQTLYSRHHRTDWARDLTWQVAKQQGILMTSCWCKNCQRACGNARILLSILARKFMWTRFWKTLLNRLHRNSAFLATEILYRPFLRQSSTSVLSLYWNRFCCVHPLSSSQFCSRRITWHLDHLVVESVESLCKFVTRLLRNERYDYVEGLHD